MPNKPLADGQVTYLIGIVHMAGLEVWGAPAGDGVTGEELLCRDENREDDEIVHRPYAIESIAETIRASNTRITDVRKGSK